MAAEVHYEQHTTAGSSQSRFGIYPSTKHHVSKNRYITSSDPRGYIPVYEYPLNGQWIMMDIDDGHILWTGIWKALGNGKADIVKMLESNPDLGPNLRRVRGGYLKIQGTWMPYEGALRLARRVAYPIREDLIPLFGPDFPESCLTPDHPEFGKVAPSGQRRRARRIVQPRPPSPRESPDTRPAEIMQRPLTAPERYHYVGGSGGAAHHPHVAPSPSMAHPTPPYMRHDSDRDRRRAQAAPYIRSSSPKYSSSYRHYDSRDRLPPPVLEGPGSHWGRARSVSTATSADNNSYGEGGSLPSISAMDEFSHRLQPGDPNAVLRRINERDDENNMQGTEDLTQPSSRSPSASPGRHFTSRTLPPPPAGFSPSMRSELPPRLQHRPVVAATTSAPHHGRHTPPLDRSAAGSGSRTAYDPISDIYRHRSYSDSWRARSPSPGRDRETRGERSPPRSPPVQWPHAHALSHSRPTLPQTYGSPSDLVGPASRISALRHSCGSD